MGFVAVICGAVLWMVQGRSFYEISPGRFITVWSSIDDQCFVIPGRYIWPMYPTRSHVRTSNNSQACGMVLNTSGDTLFYQERGVSYNIHNADSNSVFIADWNSDVERLDSLYTLAGRTYRPGVAYLTLSIHDGYALYANAPR